MARASSLTVQLCFSRRRGGRDRQSRCLETDSWQKGVRQARSLSLHLLFLPLRRVVGLVLPTSGSSSVGCCCFSWFLCLPAALDLPLRCCCCPLLIALVATLSAEFHTLACSSSRKTNPNTASTMPNRLHGPHT